MQRRIIALIAIAVLAVGLAACSSSSKGKAASGSTDTADITMQNTAFTVKGPVKAGATVSLQNKDGFDHTVTSDDGTSFNTTVHAQSSGTITAPSKPGTYKFHCNIHSTMHGELVVTS